MKILMISIISPENEGRFIRAIENLCYEHEVTILVPKSSIEIEKIKVFSLDCDMPYGFFAQIRFLAKVLKQKKMLQQGCFDLIYISNYTATIYAYFLLKHIKIRYIVYDAYELLTKTCNEKASLREKIYMYFESKLVYKANIIIAANYNRALLMQGYYRLDNTPLVVNNIPRIVDYKFIDELYNKKLCKKKEKIFIIYAGYISITRNIDKLIDAVGDLGDEYELNIYGSGPNNDKLNEQVISKGYHNINIHGKYIQEKLHEILSQSDIGFISYPNKGLNNIFCEPNKINDYANYLVPMISTPHVTLDKVLQEEGIGITNENLKIAIKEIENNLSKYIKACKDYNNRHIRNDQGQKVLYAIFEMERESVKKFEQNN